MDNLKSFADETLVKLYAEGNNEAFDVILSRYEKRLYSYILYFVRNNDVANDLFQETFVKAIVTIKHGRYTETGKFSAWLTRIAHNLIVDQFRDEKNENTVSNDEVTTDLFNNTSLAEACVETRLISDETLTDVKGLISELPDAQREVLYMRFYRDMSFKEIAQVTGVSINTALGRMRYALLNMRRMAGERHLL